MAKPYTVPEWARKSEDMLEFSLEIIKDGAVIGEVELRQRGDSSSSGNSNSKSYYILGRQPDIVDILLEHPSISRQHAVLQFRDDDALMCLDLNSAQGTFVNKQQLQQNTYQRLYVGDIIKFGASTRLYVVKGPEDQMKPEYDSENLRQFRKKLQEKSVLAAKEKSERDAATWGFDDDAEEDDEDGDMTHDGPSKQKEPAYLRNDPNYNRKYGSGYQSKLKDSDVDEKDSAKLAKLRAKEQKLQNIMEENRRIYVKESSQDDGLTEGQQAAIARNDSRIEQLTAEIDDMIHDLQGKKRHREGEAERSSIKKKKAEGVYKDEDEDDLYDLTSQTQDVSSNWRLKKRLAKHPMSMSSESCSANMGAGMTFNEIKSWVESIRVKLSDIEKEHKLNESIASSRDSSNANSTSTEDEEGINEVIQQSAAVAAKAVLSKLHSEKVKLELELKKAEKLLIAATPALQHSRLSGATPAALAGTSGNAPVVVSEKVASIVQSLLNNTRPMHDIDATIDETKTQDMMTHKSSSQPVPSHPLHQPHIDPHSSSPAAAGTVEDAIASSLSSSSSPSSSSSLGSSVEVVPSSSDRIIGPTRPLPAIAAVPTPTPTASPTPNQLIAPLTADVGSPKEDVDFHISSTATAISLPPAKTAATSTATSTALSTKAATAKELKYDNSTLQDGEKVWVKPKNQTGNGRTWLNDKFGY